MIARAAPASITVATVSGVRSRKNPNAPVEAGYSHAVALIMSNAALRTGMRATFDPEKRRVMVGGKVFTGYKSIHDGFFGGLFS